MQTSRRPLVAGNWKMNASLQLVEEMQQTLSAEPLENLDVLICPPFPYLSAFDNFAYKLGGQNLSENTNGAHTGEVSGEMLKELGCDFVIVGHSERRSDNSESDEMVARKVKRAMEAGLVPVFCFGEPLEVREGGNLNDFLALQLDAVINEVGISAFADMVLAYEPIWAIGTGKTASPEQAQEVHKFVREHLAKHSQDVAQGVRILYGGSVKAENAAELFAQPDVDGGLIGGASLSSADFLSICQAANP